MEIIKSKTPVLCPRSDIEWASGAVFNPGTWFEDGTLHMLFRGIPKGYKRKVLENPKPTGPDVGWDDAYISYIGYASSSDGINFDWRETPFIDLEEEFNKYGAEDPRISKIDDEYLITYTALRYPAFDERDSGRIGLASTRDFKTISRNGIAGPLDVSDKDAVIFPRRIDGKIVMLHRIVPNIQLITFEDLEQLHNPPPELWEEHLARIDDHVIMRPEQQWEDKKIGAGPTPIETEEGWLLIYHGVDHNHVYRMGIALLDIENPTRVIARSPLPVMEPELEFEIHGDVPNVVFPEGAVVMDEVLHVYYGAADLVIGHAQIPLRELLDGLLKHRI